MKFGEQAGAEFYMAVKAVGRNTNLLKSLGSQAGSELRRAGVSFVL